MLLGGPLIESGVVVVEAEVVEVDVPGGQRAGRARPVYAPEGARGVARVVEDAGLDLDRPRDEAVDAPAPPANINRAASKVCRTFGDSRTETSRWEPYASS